MTVPLPPPHNPVPVTRSAKDMSIKAPAASAAPPPAILKPVASAPTPPVTLSADDSHYLTQLGKREGNGDPKATNPSGAAGLHQFMPIIWIDGLIAWVPDYIHRYVDAGTLAALQDDRDFLHSVRKHIRNVDKNKWVVTSGQGKKAIDKDKTQRLQIILMKRFNMQIDNAMTLAQRDDNRSYLIAHRCAEKPTFGQEALAHEQGPVQACALIKAGRTNNKISAREVLSHVPGETKGKLKANVHQNPLIFGYHTAARILGDVDHFMGRPIGKLAKALKGRSAHHHRRHRKQAMVEDLNYYNVDGNVRVAINTSNIGARPPPYPARPRR